MSSDFWKIRHSGPATLAAISLRSRVGNSSVPQALCGCNFLSWSSMPRQYCPFCVEYKKHGVGIKYLITVGSQNITTKYNHDCSVLLQKY